MPFYIAKLVEPLRLEVEVSPDDERLLRDAVQKVREFLDGFGPFVAHLKNYEELDTFLESVNREFSQKPRLNTAHKLDVALLETNRLVMNFLSSTRSYLEMAARRLGARSDLLLKRYKTWTSVQYDQSVSYRIFENLRNFSQHHDLPIRAYRALSTLRPDGTIDSSQDFMIDREASSQSKGTSSRQARAKQHGW